jgi:hypothetical protein
MTRKIAAAMALLSFWLAWPLTAEAQCRHYGSYYTSSYSSYYPSYSYQTYYPTYQTVVVPYALTVDVVPSAYYSIDAGYGQKLKIEAEANADIKRAEAEKIRIDAYGNLFLKFQQASANANAEEKRQLLEEIRRFQQQRPPDPKGAEKIDNPKIGGNGGSGTNLASLKTVLESKCLSCHNADKKKGGLDLSNPSALSRSAWQTVWARVTIDSPKMPRMPLNKDVLTQQEMQPFAEMIAEISASN